MGDYKSDTLCYTYFYYFDLSLGYPLSSCLEYLFNILYVAYIDIHEYCFHIMFVRVKSEDIRCFDDQKVSFHGTASKDIEKILNSEEVALPRKCIVVQST